MKELLELAKLYGVQTSYIDMTNRRQQADPEALLLILRAMGVDAQGLDDVPRALKNRTDELKRRKVEPVVVAWDGKFGSRQFEFGYHDAEINGQETFVISAPTKAYSPFAVRELSDGDRIRGRRPISVGLETVRRSASVTQFCFFFFRSFTQPSFMAWRPRAIARESGGTSSVMEDPAAM